MCVVVPLLTRVWLVTMDLASALLLTLLECEWIDKADVTHTPYDYLMCFTCSYLLTPPPQVLCNWWCGWRCCSLELSRPKLHRYLYQPFVFLIGLYYPSSHNIWPCCPTGTMNRLTMDVNSVSFSKGGHYLACTSKYGKACCLHLKQQSHLRDVMHLINLIQCWFVLMMRNE